MGWRVNRHAVLRVYAVLWNSRVGYAGDHYHQRSALAVERLDDPADAAGLAVAVDNLRADASLSEQLAAAAPWMPLRARPAILRSGNLTGSWLLEPRLHAPRCGQRPAEE